MSGDFGENISKSPLRKYADNNVFSMFKSGNNFYYLQDEVGSPVYMTGTDGTAVSAYAFDDFGRNIDPFTGKQKKHAYTTNGNIIQPFAF